MLTIKKAVRGARPWPRNTSFLTTDAAAITQGDHPWLSPPRGVLPGKIEHVRALMRLHNISDGKERIAIAPMRYPLLSQPLVELCLRIPSWMWITGGRNRAVARDAFADSLPPMVLNRRTKGDFTAFCGGVYSRNRSVLREALLDGWLADNGVIDRAAVGAYLNNPAPPTTVDFYRLLEMAAVEAWAQAWRAPSR
jgi:asparagine synthase (glutamine-hydrolysing)